MMLRSDKKKTRNQKKSMINKSMAKSLLRQTKKVISAKQKQKQNLDTKKKLVQIVDSEITFNFKKEIKKKPVPLNEKPVLPNNNENIPDKHSSVIIPNQSESTALSKLIQGIKFKVDSILRHQFFKDFKKMNKKLLCIKNETNMVYEIRF